MSDLLSILKKWELKKINDSFRVIEFFGTPGSGKTHLSNIAYKKLNHNTIDVVNKLSIDVGKMNSVKRVIIKIFFVFYLIVINFSVALNVIKLVREFHFKADCILIKLSFNFLYVMGVMQFCKNHNQMLIMDQGISQSIWSCIFHGNNANFNFDIASSLLIKILTKIKLNNLLVTHVKVEIDKIEVRLKTRGIKGTSLLNSGNKKIIRKGVETTIKARNFLDHVSRHMPSFSIVDCANN
jgi:Cdc6-like AAA superfamily ATPase